MFIRRITVEGVGGDVEIRRTDAGAEVVSGGRVLGRMGRADGPEARMAVAREMAKAVCGVTRPSRFGPAGEPNATHSMIHDLLREIERVAGC